MSYDLYPPPRAASWRRALIVGLCTLAALSLIWSVGHAFRDQDVPGAASPAQPTEQPADAPAVRLVVVPGGTVSVSDRHGPAHQREGLAAGFSHDERGAAVAAVNLAVRVSSAAGPEVYEPTIRNQGYGDPDAMLQRNRAERPVGDTSAETGATRFSELRYRVISGDPTGDSVVISMLATTGQARDLGGFARLDVTLRWVDGDWRLQVPTARPLLYPTAEGYTLLASQP